MNSKVNIVKKEDANKIDNFAYEKTLIKKYPKLLELLLTDNTTKRNIIWATNSYLKYGHKFKDFITLQSYLNNVIVRRSIKNKNEQIKRVKENGEVFTPSWMCNEQNNLIDEYWFGKKSVFNYEINNTWKVNKNKVCFDDKKWVDYVKDVRLELCCGEAPYLASRYDTVTGRPLPLDERIGILDRKFRIICENCSKKEEWIKQSIIALKSVYGYEYQGDSLLLARENVLFTFIDYYRNMFNDDPDEELMNEVATIISWNLWQMDGIKTVIPDSCKPVLKEQMSLFPEDDEYVPCEGCLKENNRLHTGIYCKIKIWEKNTTIKFIDLKGDKNMKFNFVIGNPPYQEVTAIKETENGQKTVKSIFQYFQISADEIAKNGSCLIYPAKRWIHRSGKGMKDFGYSNINDNHLSKLIVYPNASDVFPSTEISDGVSIVLKKYDKTTNGFTYVRKSLNEKSKQIKVNNPKEDLLIIEPNDIIIFNKISNFCKKNDIGFLHESVMPQKLFGLESNLVEVNPKLFRKYDGTPLKSNEIKVLINDKGGKAGRATWFVSDEKIISKSNLKYLHEYQVVASSASPGGQKRDNQLEIIDNHSAFGRSRVAFKSFKEYDDAKNFFEYMKTPIIKYCLLLTDEALNSVAKKVPDFDDYSKRNKFINFSNDINKQLIDLFDLDENDIKHIKSQLEIEEQ